MLWIAQEVADTKYSVDIRPLFKQAKEIAEKNPKALITDGAANFHEAFVEFYTAKQVTRLNTFETQRSTENGTTTRKMA